MTTPWSLAFYLPADKSDTSKLGRTFIEGHSLSLSLSHGHLGVTDTTLNITAYHVLKSSPKLSFSTKSKKPKNFIL